MVISIGIQNEIFSLAVLSFLNDKSSFLLQESLLFYWGELRKFVYMAWNLNKR